VTALLARVRAEQRPQVLAKASADGFAASVEAERLLAAVFGTRSTPPCP
jgi:hypothetical protein